MLVILCLSSSENIYIRYKLVNNQQLATMARKAGVLQISESQHVIAVSETRVASQGKDVQPKVTNSFSTRFVLFLLHNYGLFPDENSSKYYWIYSYIFHFLFSTLYVVCALIYAGINLTDMEKSTDALSSTLTILSFVLKMINYHYYRQQIVDFVPKLYALRVFESPDEIDVAKVANRFLSQLTMSFYFCGHITIIIGCFKAFREVEPEMPMVSWFPCDWQHDSLSFWIVYPYAVACCFIIMHVNIGLDCFAAFMMDSIGTQFDITAVRLEKLGTMVKSNDDEMEKLTVLAKRHQHLLHLVHEMDDFLSIQFFIQIVLSGLVFCSGVYHLTSLDMPEEYLQFLYESLFMGCILFEVFSYTYFAQRILTSTNALTNATYFSKWYVMPLNYRKHLILLMERMKRNSVITAGKLFEMNLALFTTIVSFSHRLYALRSSVAHKNA